jgi:NADH-quinone oxidoreductase subunit M
MFFLKFIEFIDVSLTILKGHFFTNLLFYLFIFSFFFVLTCSRPLIRRVSFIFSLIISLYVVIFLMPVYADFHSLYFSFIDRFFLPGFQPTFSVDGISMVFIFLTVFIFPFVFRYSVSVPLMHTRAYFFSLFLTEFLLILLFMVEDLFVFFVLFELLAFPIFVLILIAGSTSRRKYAALTFLFYTVGASLPLLALLVFFQFSLGSTNYWLLSSWNFPVFYQTWFLVCFLIAFGMKIPLVPLHLWLTEAHVEASTAISVLLAALLLKLGGYGLIRFCLPLCRDVVLAYSWYLFLFCLFSVFISMIAALRQNDLKKAIAYSSITHMSFSTLALFTGSNELIAWSIYSMLNHGFVAASLFTLVGFLYSRGGLRVTRAYSGLAQSMPVFSLLFGISMFANIAFPFTSPFAPELNVIRLLYSLDPIVAVLALVAMNCYTVAAVWIFTKLVFGPSVYSEVKSYKDITIYEYELIVTLLIAVFLYFDDPFHLMDLLLRDLHRFLLFI